MIASERELDFAYSVAGLSRFRVNVHMQRGSVAAVLRAISMHPPTLDQLKALVLAKQVTAEVAAALAHDPEHFKTFLNMR